MRRVLVIVHLSSLDSYTRFVGENEASRLAESIDLEVWAKYDAIIVTDQKWAKGSDSYARKSVLESLKEVVTPVFVIKHTEETGEPWGRDFGPVVRKLASLQATHVTVVGVWYSETGEGCVNETALQIQARMPGIIVKILPSSCGWVE